jgi:alpha-N-arabinofuranosidase
MSGIIAALDRWGRLSIMLKMFLRSLQIGGAVAAILIASLRAANPADGSLQVRIDASKPSAPVSRYEYGMFIEPIGTLMARSLWAEMLDDRKFYFPVVAEGKDPEQPKGVEGRPSMLSRKWRPIGGDGTVKMDPQHAYVGAHSVRVTLDGEGVHGFGQSGMGLAKGRSYIGHILLTGAPTAAVAVALVWGDGPQDRQAVSMPSLDGDWRSVTLRFTAGADAANARFEIVGGGTGTFNVGVVSLMPADNVDGWRADTTNILRMLHSGFWRLPGGNFLSNWDWHGALGPRDRRAPMFDHAWSAMQPNDMGMDEYMTLTRILDVEPYVTVNAGLGDANSAAEEVDYLNGPAGSEWGGKRAANGHPEPYGIKYWNIGNEPYGWWQVGKTSLDYFMIKHNEFAAAMRAADSTITLIGSGAMPDQLHARDAKENASLESIQHKFGTEEDWTGGLLAQAWGNFDGISEHWYDRAEQRLDAPLAEEGLEFVRAPSNQVRMKADEWAIYQSRFPAMKDKGIFLSIDEYAYVGAHMGAPSTLKLALAYSMVLQEMLRHTDFLKMSALTMGISTLDITPTAATLNSVGEVFKLYGEHFGEGAIPLAIDGNSPQPEPKYAVGFDHPKVRAGSPTYPLDVIAALSSDRHLLKIGVVNATLQPQPLRMSLQGIRVTGAGRTWTLSGATLDVANKVGAAPGVTIREQPVPALGTRLTVPPISTIVYEFPAGQSR